MDKSIKLLLTYLDDKSQDITDNDYLNGCNFLKEYHRENKELTESLYIIQKQLLILTCKVNDLENSIKNNNSNEEILNALHKKVNDMAECLNVVGLSLTDGIPSAHIRGRCWDPGLRTESDNKSISDELDRISLSYLQEHLLKLNNVSDFGKGALIKSTIRLSSGHYAQRSLEIKEPFTYTHKPGEAGMGEIWKKYKEVSDWDF